MWPESIFAATIGLLILLATGGLTPAQREIELCQKNGGKVVQVLDKTICAPTLGA